MFLRMTHLCLIAAFCFACAQSEDPAPLRTDAALGAGRLDEIKQLVKDLRDTGVEILAKGEGCNMEQKLTPSLRMEAYNQLHSIKKIASEVAIGINDFSRFPNGQVSLQNIIKSVNTCINRVEVVKN